MNNPINKFVNAFYVDLAKNTFRVTQFLNSRGIKKDSPVYFVILDMFTIEEWTLLLRFRLNASYGQKWELPHNLEAAEKTLGIKGYQNVGAVMYLEISGVLFEYLKDFIRGKNDISEMNCFYVAVTLAEMEMCAIAIGLQGLQNKWHSAAGKKKKGTEGYLKHALRKICLSIGSTSWPKVKVLLKDRGKIQEWYESTKDPINIHGFQFTGIQGDRREERKEDLLHYTTRDNQPKKILVASVMKTLSIIKKENNL